jgi:hypothetical protein
MKTSLLLFSFAIAPIALLDAADAASETTVNISVTGSARLAEGSRRYTDTAGTHLHLGYDTTLPFKGGGTLLAGLALDQRQFDPPNAAPVPDHLSSIALNLGWRQAIDERWSWEAAAQPGVYGEKLGSGAGFGAPLTLRFIRASSANLQWAAGLDYDARSGHPLVGGIGVRWKFAPKWTLLALPPAPRLEYEYSPQLTYFAGAELQRGTYRVADNFGRQHGRPTLDGLTLDYRETVLAAGVRWHPAASFELCAEAGWLVDRRFAFQERELLVHGAGAASGRIALTHRY